MQISSVSCKYSRIMQMSAAYANYTWTFPSDWITATDVVLIFIISQLIDCSDIKLDW